MFTFRLPRALQDFTLESINLRAGEHKKPEFLAKQPFGIIPVFEDDGLEIFGAFIDNTAHSNDFEVVCSFISSASCLVAFHCANAESRAIMRYIAEKYAGQGTDLLGETLKVRQPDAVNQIGQQKFQECMCT